MENEKAFDRDGKKVKSRFIVDVQTLPVDDPLLLAETRLHLSERVKTGEIYGFLEIGPKVYDAPPVAFDLKKKTPEIPEAHLVAHHTNRPLYQDFSLWALQVINLEVLKARLEKYDLTEEKLRAAMPVPVVSKGLYKRDEETGEVREGGEGSKAAGFFVPFFLIMLMFMVIMSGATPLMQGVVEEKMQRIAEVLLGSVPPFQLMLGKLLGMTGVSLTVGGVYLGGAFWLAHRFEIAEYATVSILLWFFLFQALAALMYGSIFIAIGAACSDMKETQNLLWPVMLIICIPLFMITHVIQEPNGPVATTMSFVPFATPMLMIARLAIPPGVPSWQPVVGIGLVIGMTVLCVYAAGRIFRVGILMQGKGAKFGEVLRWVFRG